MKLPRLVSSSPQRLRTALMATAGPVFLDIESTGLGRLARTVSVACLIDDVAFVLPIRSAHGTVKNIPLADIAGGMAPLRGRSRLVVVGHNILFDLRILARDDIHISAEIRDTQKLLKLLDPDRGATDKQLARIDRRDPPQLLSNKLKPTVQQMLNVQVIGFPGDSDLLPWPTLKAYSISDVAATRALYEHLWGRLSRRHRRYYRQLISPLAPLLLAMTAKGITADSAYMANEHARLCVLFDSIAEQHRAECGRMLSGITEKDLREWLFETLGLEPQKPGRKRGWAEPSLDDEALELLVATTTDPKTLRSLDLIRQRRALAEALKTFGTLAKHVARDGRIHPNWDDKQNSGRISCTDPNLQALARVQSVAGTEIRLRDSLISSPGHTLVAFDVAQADIRVLAAMTELCQESTTSMIRRLHQKRLPWLNAQVHQLRHRMSEFRNPDYKGETAKYREFYPHMKKNLAGDFRSPADFYSTVFERLFKRQPKDKAERDWFKPIVLSIVNGKGAPSLAKDLRCTQEEAAEYMKQFNKAYPEVAAYRDLLCWRIALTGLTRTFMGRPRRSTPHWWMTHKSRLQLFITYKGRDRLWLDVIPLRPGLRTLTCFIVKVWDADERSKNHGKLIFHHQRGRLSTLPYRFFNPPKPLLYRLPYRGISWRSIRRVRCGHEEAMYYGMDRTVRALANHVYQGGTADVVKLMMLRVGPICKQFGVHIVLQVHDELVFDVPEDRWRPFVVAVKPVLEAAPIPSWNVPIVVEAKAGQKFGSLDKVDVDAL